MKLNSGRNARDFGGWKTLDGKTIKYRKIYRGGRLNEKWSPYPLNKQGEKEVLFEGIGAELDLRGNSDVMFTPAVEGLDHCAPVIEQGGKTMLVNDKEKTKECFMFVYISDKNSNPIPTFKNTRMAWVYSDVVPYFWELAGQNGTFADGVEKYLTEVAGVAKADIDEFRSLMLE